jgi:predicted permease
MATRAALGAGRARLLRQLLTESLLLALVGGILGVIFAEISLLLIHAVGATRVPRLAEIAINGQVMLFTLAISMMAGGAFGLAPAVRVWYRRDLAGTLHEGDRGSGRGNQLRRLLVVGELALSVVLLIGAGLLLRSFARLEQVPPGFTPRNLLTFELTMSGRKYATGPVVVQSYKQLCDRLEQLPGVTAAGITSALPLSEMYAWGPITVEGRPLPPGEVFINADERMVGGDYFPAMQIPLLRGRFFDLQDTPDKPRVAIVDEHMARELWPNQDAIGRRIHTGGAGENSPWITVVGVVGRVKQSTLDSDPRIAFYLPHLQYPVRAMNVVVRGSTAESSLATSVKAAAHEMDPELPLYNVRTMQDRVNASLARQRFSMLLLTLFAGLAAILAALGTYGVTSYLVNQGTREIGIRIALGATPKKILALILSRGLTATLLGVTIGAMVAAALSRLIESLLFEVRPTDPLIFAAVVSLLLLTALLATYLPARRAARTDPLVSLRCE